MSRILAIDPGLRCLGAAYLADGVVVDAALIRAGNKTDRGPNQWADMADATAAWVGDRPVSTVVIEFPIIIKTGRGRFAGAKPDDILRLACIDAAVCGAVKAYQYVEYTPPQWKGTVPPDVMTERIIGWLTDDENALFDGMPESLKHNAIDAAGIGVFHARRVGERE